MGVDEAFAGDLLGGAGEAGCLSNVLTAPLFGSLITIPAFFRAGIWKVADLGAGLFVPRLVITGWATAGVIGVCGCGTLVLGRSDTADGDRDIEAGC